MNCIECGELLTGRKKKYCSASCSKLSGRRAHIQKCFNLTLEQYDQILEEQGGGCGICGKSPKSGKSLAVDHAHRDGRAGPVRGLLCFLCNRRILGARSDSVVLAMAEYVRNPPARRALNIEVIAPGRPQKKRQPRKRKRNGI